WPDFAGYSIGSISNGSSPATGSCSVPCCSGRRGSAVARADRPGAAKARQSRIEVTLEGLRQALERFDQGRLDPNDRPLLRALLWNEVARAEGRDARRIARVLAKAQAAQEASGK